MSYSWPPARPSPRTGQAGARTRALAHLQVMTSPTTRSSSGALMMLLAWPGSRHFSCTRPRTTDEASLLPQTEHDASPAASEPPATAPVRETLTLRPLDAPARSKVSGPRGLVRALGHGGAGPWPRRGRRDS